MQVDHSENAWQIFLLKLSQRAFHFSLRLQTIETIMEIIETASCLIQLLIHQPTLNFSECLDTSLDSLWEQSMQWISTSLHFSGKNFSMNKLQLMILKVLMHSLAKFWKIFYKMERLWVKNISMLQLMKPFRHSFQMELKLKYVQMVKTKQWQSKII